MSPENDAKLRAIAPHLFAGPLINGYPIQCGDGWVDILGFLFQQLDKLIANEPPDKRKLYRVVQVKEKFGTLRVYLDAGSTDAMTVLIEAAERLSAQTCDVCGERGELRGGGKGDHWMRTRCDQHADWREWDTGFAHGSKG